MDRNRLQFSLRGKDRYVREYGLKTTYIIPDVPTAIVRGSTDQNRLKVAPHFNTAAKSLT